MIQFLWQGGHGSHGPRAQTLARITGSREGDIATTKPSQVQALDTLTFWGHGDANKLCDKTPDQLIAIIAEWKALNAGLRTVEVITCNARHCARGDSYVGKLKSRLGFRTHTRGITIKALPVTVSGKMNAWSILLAETQYSSWVYVTAPGATDKLLMEASSLIQFRQNESGGLSSYRGDIALRANEMVKAHPEREWTMNYGYFGTLRANLVAIH